MSENNTTALISAFARAYHSQCSTEKIHDDSLAAKILLPEEYARIAESMTGGISFFYPGFAGTPQDGLRWIVDNQLAPTVLGRAGFAEQALQEAVAVDTGQYVILAAGYDTFAWRQPDWAKDLRIFEVDHPDMSRDKQKRAKHLSDKKPSNLFFVESDFTHRNPLQGLENIKDYRRDRLTFFSLLGISYYLSEGDFTTLIKEIARISPAGSRVVLDYPDENTYTESAEERTKKQVALAAGAGETMRASYSSDQMEALFASCGFAVCENLQPQEITERFFWEYNQRNPVHPISAFDNVNYCLARLENPS